MSDENEFNLARMALGELELHRNKSSEKTQFAGPDLDYGHKKVLSVIGHEDWVSLQQIFKASGMRMKQVKKHLKFLEDNELIHKKREDGTKKYQRL